MWVSTVLGATVLVSITMNEAISACRCLKMVYASFYCRIFTLLNIDFYDM